MKMGFSAAALRERLSYDPESGVFVWLPRTSGRDCKRWNTRYAGRQAGRIDAHGYVIIAINHIGYKAHRLAWLYSTGSWPADQIDHRDGDTCNNRLSNLREATNAGNQQNRKRPSQCSSAYHGVSWHAPARKWQARICICGRQKHLGTFGTPKEASAAYLKAKAEHHTFQPVPRDLIPTREAVQ